MKFLKKSTTSGHKQILENITLSTSDTVVTYFLRGELIFLLVIMGLKILKLSGMSHKIVEMHDYSFLPFKCQMFKSFFLHVRFLARPWQAEKYTGDKPFVVSKSLSSNMHNSTHTWYEPFTRCSCDKNNSSWVAYRLTRVPIQERNLPVSSVTRFSFSINIDTWKNTERILHQIQKAIIYLWIQKIFMGCKCSN